MSDALLAAIIGAIAVFGVQAATQFFSYRLRLKEFRVAQLQKWIDALERAEFHIEAVPDRREGESGEVFFYRVMKDAAVHTVTEVWLSYDRLQPILTLKGRLHFEKTLADAKAAITDTVFSDIGSGILGSPISTDTIRAGIAKTKFGHLLKEWDVLRTSSINELYAQLKREVGIN